MKSKLCSFLLALLLFAARISGQSVLPLQHINVEEGLSQSTVYSVLNDKEGFIWFATGDGISRYDGKDFISYKTKFSDSLSAYPKDRNINSRLVQDISGRIWLTSDAGLSFVDSRHRSSRLVHESNIMGNGFLIGIVDDSLWIGIHNQGLFAMDVHSFVYHRYSFPSAANANPKDNNIIIGAAITQGGIWLADELGLLFFDRRSCSFHRAISSPAIAGLQALHDGTLLMGTMNGLFRYFPSSGRQELIPIKFSEMDMLWSHIVEDSVSRNIYASARHGGTIARLDLQSGSHEFLEFQSANINTLFIDRSRNLWVGTDGEGAYKLDIKKPKFNCFPVNTTFETSAGKGLMVKSIYCDEKGRFWIGSFYQGLLIYDPQKRQCQSVVLPSFKPGGAPIGTIMKDSSQNILLSYGNYMLWLDPNTFRIKDQFHIGIDKTYPVEGMNIYAIEEWKAGHYLLGTNVGLISLVKEKDNFRFYRPYQFGHTRYISSWIYNLQRQPNGDLYLAERSGFGKVRILGDTTLEILDGGFENVPVRSFYKSQNSPFLWIASELGLVAYNENTKRYKVFDESTGMANSYVYGILPENDTSLWISTNGGLANVKVRYSRDSTTARFTNYTAKDGLQSDEFNTGAFFRRNNGVLVFGGINGINWFDPKVITSNPYRAMPAIAAIEVNDTLYASDTANFIREFTMPYRRNTISFSLRALEFTNAARNRFAYKLEGLDNDWVFTSNDKVRYSNLSPGHYTFWLKVSNNEGLWNDQPLKVELVILPPFWRTWWFISLMVLAAAGVIYFSVWYYIRQRVKAKTLALERQQALYLERLRISKDVHDDLGSGLSKITLMAELAAKQKNGNPKLNDTIDDISQISRDLVGNMRDLVWVLNPENTALDSLAARMREYCSDYFDGLPQHLQLDFQSNIPNTRISQEAQRNIFLTAKEALNNCVKHSGGKNITVGLSLCGELLLISIVDDGDGFDTASQANGNGLKNMRQRIEAIGGEFGIWSGATGTAIKVAVPIAKIEINEITH
jgi:signal transduction histidine kinase/ligand-binding sensor domain-containing protein